MQFDVERGQFRRVPLQRAEVVALVGDVAGGAGVGADVLHGEHFQLLHRAAIDLADGGHMAAGAVLGKQRAALGGEGFVDGAEQVLRPSGRLEALQGLIDRGNMSKNGKALAATPAAFSLIDAVPRAIADPGTTAIWEQALDMVQSGEMTLDIFVAKQAAWMRKHIERCSAMTMTINGPASPAGGAPAWKKKRKAPAGKAKVRRATKT